MNYIRHVMTTSEDGTEAAKPGGLRLYHGNVCPLCKDTKMVLEW